MPLSTSQKAYLGYLAQFGDLNAQAIVEATETGVEKIIALVDTAAKGANDVVTAKAANLAGTTALGTSFAIEAAAAAKLLACPRNLRCVFAALWDGGDITVVGTNQFGEAQTEVIADNAGNTVVGEKVWKTVTSISKQAVGATANTVTVGTGDKLACGKVKVNNAFAQLLTDGAAEAVTIDVANSGFTPTTVPDGSHDYQLLVRSVA